MTTNFTWLRIKRPQQPGAIGWGMIVLGVCLWDYLVADSLTQAFRRGLHRNPLVACAWLLTTAHLFGWIPARVDPFVIIAFKH